MAIEAKAPAPAPAPAPAAPAPAASSLFADDADDEARRAEAKKEERRRRLQQLQLDNAVDKQIGSGGQPAPAPAPAEEEEEDPLDAFMRTQVVEQAEKEKERAAAHTAVWQAQYGDKNVEISDVVEEEKNMNLHCYVCKQWGHTKVNCPHKRCKFCGKEGHVADDCPAKDEKIAGQFADEKTRKRQKQYAAKKAKKKEEWEAQLRSKTGVDGFHVLYEILGLPPRKLASKEQIKRAYRLQSLRYHPDKVLPEEAEEAAEKFMAVKTAYDLLLEGMETGGKGMGGAVFSGGDLTYAGPGWEQQQAAASGGGGGGGAASVGPPAGGAAGTSSAASTITTAEDEEEMDGALQAERLQAMAAAAAAKREAAEEADGEEEVCQPVDKVEGAAAAAGGADTPPCLTDAELRSLLADAEVAGALKQIADSGALGRPSAVVMGVLCSLCTTHKAAIEALEERGEGSAGGAPMAID